MASYSAVDGVPLCANRKLLTDALRTEFGFNGWVVSDCGCVTNVAATHHYVPNATYAAAAAVAAGVDVFCDDAVAELPRAVAMGLLPAAALDTALFRVISQQLKLGLFDPHDGRNPYDTIDGASLDSAAHRALARDAAAQAVVLLGNSHGVLPLRRAQSVAVLGPSANEAFTRTPWVQNDALHPFYLHIYNGIPTTIVTPFAAIAKRARNATFVKGCLRRGSDTSGIGAAVAAAKAADVAVVLVGLEAAYEQEDVDRTHDTNNPWALPGPQQALVDAVVASGTPVVLVLVNGGPLTVREPTGGALVEAFYGGQAAGDGLADVLYGDVSPAGRMPVSTYLRSSDAGDINNYDMTAGKGRTYRYLAPEAEPLYPFGYGLSYTRWHYGPLRLVAPDPGGRRSGAAASGVARVHEGDTVQLALNLTNVGGVDGAEVAQLYLALTPTFGAQRSDVSRHVPSRQLVAYEKVHVARGATAELTFAFSPVETSGWGFFDEPITRVYLAAGGVSPTRATLSSRALVITELDVMRRGE